jgi:bifunctional DNA-binding transcriptional regulator/antitoxin component of YhaV-PrlF toxin-antitoxin module
MEITCLSSEGQVFIPKTLRDLHQWEIGQELIATDIGDGILLKPKKPFPKTTLAQVIGCLKYKGHQKSLDQLEDSIRLAVMEQWHENGMDFADALHLAQSQNCYVIYTFDIKFVDKAKGLTRCEVQHPR